MRASSSLAAPTIADVSAVVQVRARSPVGA